ncbi:MAG TPA: 3'-5' exonuclease domain-containing protein 2 [Cytophagales bacterium]|nr:3'-5' exonuclease domain-containing protein 2 [Cytophagales bacterium]HAA20971.1 3'-5' exonuclease domain-containing protein 2 [Cytophagales bacterium]HAP62611.1 3'-5' exonuclease domain-containing protein 2 [Cytophagales bacterium]
MFPNRITKEEVNQLPPGRYEGEVVIISDPKDVGPAMAEIQRHPVAGWDTETKPAFKKGQNHPTALLQIAIPDKVFLFQLLKTGFPLEMIRFFENPDITKPGVAILDDVRGLKKIRPFSESGVVELADLATKLGIETTGARNLTAIFLGFRISKNQQTSNWEKNPLTEGQVRYAATDAWICLEIFEYLFRTGYLEKL